MAWCLFNLVRGNCPSYRRFKRLGYRYKQLYVRRFLARLHGQKSFASTEGASVSDLTLDYINLISTVLCVQ
jgi:hypothetical protein